MAAAEACGWGRKSLFALGLVFTALVAWADNEPSAAEQAVFQTPHLAGFEAPGVLHYNYREQNVGQPVIEDTADLSVERDGDASYRVTARYLSGERQLALPVVSQAQSNPVVLYFLEQDVRRMHADLGGATNYFRRHIRLALANAAEVSPVSFSVGGASYQGTKISIQPFKDVPKAERMQGQEHKRYEFIVSPAVPGGVYALRTNVPGKDGKMAHEISLTLTSGDS